MPPFLKMERIIIKTDLNNFILIDGITEVNAANIKGVKHFSNAPIYSGIESLAQLGACHVRFLASFERHAFLLKIICCKAHMQQILNGSCLLCGTLISRSKSASVYKLYAKKGDKVWIEGKFLYATVDYNSSFKREILQKHYRKVFSCLLRNVDELTSTIGNLRSEPTTLSKIKGKLKKGIKYQS